MTRRTCCDSPIGFGPHATDCRFVRVMATRRKHPVDRGLNTNPNPWGYVPARQP